MAITALVGERLFLQPFQASGAGDRPMGRTDNATAFSASVSTILLGVFVPEQSRNAAMI
jgi:hypothetical protein